MRSAALALFLGLLLLPAPSMAQTDSARDRPRARELGIRVGIFQPGPWNAITDVAGVRVGHTTVVEGDQVRTGVTAILPHDGNPYRSRVPAAIHVGNGFGKLLGVTQVRELGEMETPVLLTCTLCVWRAADAMVGWMLEQEDMQDVRSLNPLVGETNDGGLNDIRARPITPEHVRTALEGASSGPVPEGSVGAGTGTRAFGWKGGIGTSSRILPASLGGHAVGVLVQSNFGGILTIAGATVGQELGRYSFRGAVENNPGGDGPAEPTGGSTDLHPGRPTVSERTSREAVERGWLDQEDTGQGSIMIVVATDAPLSDRNLERVARRAVMGLARTGSFAGNGSGDYVIAFSTDPSVRRAPGASAPSPDELGNDAMSALFQATVEATEEAIYNSLLKATPVTGMGRTADALPIDETVAVLRRYGVLGND
ncbi:MAG: P1 family peptidase [Gemmatimonadota bacterium]